MSRSSILSMTNSIVFWAIVIAIGAFWFFGKPGSVGPSADEWFQSEVAQEERPVLVKFGAEWCGPCHVMDDSIDKVAPEFGDQVKFVRVDVDQNKSLANHYRISSIPRTFLFQHGKIIAEQSGALDPTRLKSWIQDSIAHIKD
jgi:thioredoxin